MTSSEHLDSPLLASAPSDKIYNDSHNDISLPTVVFIPSSTLRVSIRPSLEKLNEDGNTRTLNKNRKCSQPVSMSSVSRRLAKRKELHNRLCLINDMMCFLGLLGVILMIIENEITFTNVHNEETDVSWIIKILITISTMFLVSLVFYYHFFDLQLYNVNNSLDHWQIGLTNKKVFMIILEALICAIHPFPRTFPFIWNIKYINSMTPPIITTSYVAIDVALGLPMFVRIYLLCRFIMFHSHLMHDTASQSLGYLNEVSINIFFLFKTYLEQWPVRCLLAFCTFILLVASWSLRACNYYSTGAHMSMLDSMWLFIVTFTTVGYGDIYPSTYCGRGVAAFTGLVGVLATALLISVLAQKLELSRSEKYVHNFVLKNGLANERKQQAANVIKFALKIWYLRQKHRRSSNDYIQAERRLFRSIHFNQQLKKEQKILIDSCVGLPEIITAQREAISKTEDNTQRLVTVESKVDKLEQKLVDMNQTMMNIDNTLNSILSRMTQ